MAEKAKTKAQQPEVGFYKMLRDVLVTSMNRGQFPIALFGLIVIAIIFKMPSEDVGRLAFAILEKLENGALFGYMLFVATTGGWFFHARRYRIQLASLTEQNSEA